MADRNLELALRMRADLQQARRQLQQVEQELGGIAQGGDRAQRGMRKLGREADRTERKLKGVSNASRTLKRAMAGITAGLVLRQFVRATDTYTNLESQLRLVTDSQEELNEVQRETYELANETRQRLEATVNLYARLARATEELNLSNDQLLTLTKAINQSFIVSGASATEAAASILQLSQGIASGTLRGEELNSVLENSPRLARALADGLGVTIGELRKLGEEGRLTGEAVTRALLSTADGIERDFQQMQRNVGQALTQLRNDLINTFGQSETQGFVDAIDELRAVVTDPAFRQGVVDIGTFIAELVGDSAAAATQVGSLVREFRKLQPYTTFDLAGGVASDFNAFMDQFRAPEALEIKAVYQGCADAGICYPPQTRLLAVSLPAEGMTNSLSPMPIPKQEPTRWSSTARPRSIPGPWLPTPIQMLPTTCGSK